MCAKKNENQNFFGFKGNITTSVEIPSTSNSNLPISNDLQEETEINLTVESEQMETDENLPSLDAHAVIQGHYIFEAIFGIF